MSWRIVIVRVAGGGLRLGLVGCLLGGGWGWGLCRRWRWGVDGIDYWAEKWLKDTSLPDCLGELVDCVELIWECVAY